MTNYNLSDICVTAGQVKDFVELRGDLPVWITVNGVSMNRANYLRLLMEGTKKMITGDPTPTGTGVFKNPDSSIQNCIPGKLMEDEYISVAGRVSSFMDTSYAPRYATTSLGNVGFSNLIYIYSRILHFYAQFGYAPGYVNVTTFNTSTTSDPTPTPVKSQFHQAVEGVVGLYSTFTEYYNWIKQNSSWEGYYNDIYNQFTELTRLRDRLPLNCTDHTQLGYAVAIDLGYETKYMKVECKSGGHIYFLIHGKEFKDWTTIDLAAAANSQYDVGSRWCSYNEGYSIDNLVWIKTDDGIT